MYCLKGVSIHFVRENRGIVSLRESTSARGNDEVREQRDLVVGYGNSICTKKVPWRRKVFGELCRHSTDFTKQRMSSEWKQAAGNIDALGKANCVFNSFVSLCKNSIDGRILEQVSVAAACIT